MKEFRCPVHLCLGQEQVPADLYENLIAEDWLFSTHRSHGHYLAKGGSESMLWNEIMGLPSGVNRGFAGSQCFSDPSINFHATAIVGGLFGAAAGVALAIELDGAKDNNVVVCCFGDGATEQGVFWETLNFCATNSLPVVFICENNRYSVHSHLSERQPTSFAIGDRIRAFGVITMQMVSDAIRQCRKHREPYAVVIDCERECNHVGNMPDFRHGEKP